VHTSNSDGKLSPYEVISLYKSLGYDFVGITDHDFVTPNTGVPGILQISGVEETSRLGHITVLGINKESPSLEPTAIISTAVSQGGIAFMSHPNSRIAPAWPAEGLTAAGHVGVEVFNAAAVPYYSEDRWDWLLRTQPGRTIWGFPADDFHIRGGENKAWAMVYAPRLTQRDIVESLRSGYFYATQGPDINVWLLGATMMVETTEGATIEFITANGIKHLSSNVTVSSYAANPDDIYVRARVTRMRDGKKAWGQPAWCEMARSTGNDFRHDAKETWGLKPN
jgi:hypothetical protein